MTPHRMNTKITLASFFLLMFSALSLSFVLVPTTVLGQIVVCGDCCQEPYEASGIYGDGPSGSCVYTGNSWDACWTSSFTLSQGYDLQGGCGGCAGVSCEYPTTSYTLTTRVSPTGSGTISPSSRSYTSGTAVSISKTAATGYVFSSWSGDCTGTVDICRITMNSNKSVTANFVSNTPTFTVSISRTPSTGDVNTTFNFTVTTGGTATGTITYGTPSCGSGGVISNWTGSSDNTFSCRYSTSGSKIVTASATRQTLSRTASNSFTVAAAPTLGATLTVSPTSGGDTTTTYNLTTTVTGTVTGTIAYGTPTCGSGGTLSNWSGSTDNTFSCRYSSTGTKAVTAPVTRGGLSASGSASISVGAVPTLGATLTVSPTSGGDTTTTYNLTTTVTGTVTGTIAYGTPTCGSGGTLSNWSGSTDNTFSCRYSSTGTKAVTAPVTRGGLSASGSASISVGAVPTLGATLTVSPTSGGDTTTTYNLTTTVTGTVTGTIAYGTPTCGSGGTLSNWSGSTDNTFSCRYSSTGTKAVTAPVTRGGLSASGSASISVGAVPTLGATLTVSPTSGGDTTTTYNLTTTVTGTVTGTIAYGTPTCGSGGTLSNWSGSTDNTFSCRYSSTGTKAVTAPVTRGGLSASGSASISVGAVPTLGATLTVSPTSGGDTTTTYNLTTTVTGTVTGTIAYGTPTCGSGGTLSNWSGSTDNTFSCRYSSTGTKAVTAPVTRGGLSASGSASISVGAVPTLGVNLTVSPTSGGIPGTVYNFTTVPTGTATGTITYGTPNCDGVTPTNWSGSLTGNTFSCTYLSSGARNVTSSIARGGLNASRTIGVTVGAASIPITGLDVTVTPRWIPRGGSVDLSWETIPLDPGDTTVCQVNGGAWSPYDPTNPSTRTMPFPSILQVTQFTVSCSDGVSFVTNSATVYTLPTFG
jgi:hypothetical protein